MSTTHKSRLTRGALALALIVTAFTVLATGASAATKQFSLSITQSSLPPSVGAGTTQTYSATITNESGGTLDSVTVASTGFTISSPSGGTFTGLGLGSGDSTTRSLTALTPCVAAGSFSWTATGRSSNNQPYTMDAATSHVSGTVTGTCSLSLSHVGSGENGAVLSQVDYTPAGAAVKVQLLDATSALSTAANGTVVDLALSSNASALSGKSATLSGTGEATYPSLKVSVSALSYTVTTSTGNGAITNATSNTFQIWDKDIKCLGGSLCHQSYKAGDLTTDPSTTFGANDGILISYDVQSPADLALCGTDAYTHLPDVVTIDSETATPTGDWVITFSVSKQYDQNQAQNGASHYQLCLATTLPFTTLDGSPAAGPFGGFYYGLVQNSPQCTEPAPCILSTTKSRTGIVIIVLRLDAGDPWTH
jgi:hypothetical protein